VYLYEIRPRKDGRGVDLVSEALPFGRLWYQNADAAGTALGKTRQIDVHSVRVDAQPRLRNAQLRPSYLAPCLDF
jgi:hypothetical protein